jgi:hypothetical protein
MLEVGIHNGPVLSDHHEPRAGDDLGNCKRQAWHFEARIR